MNKKRIDDSKTMKRITILYTFCAVVWIINSYIKWENGVRGADLGIVVFCAILWTISSVLGIMRYHNLKQEGK